MLMKKWRTRLYGHRNVLSHRLHREFIEQFRFAPPFWMWSFVVIASTKAEIKALNALISSAAFNYDSRALPALSHITPRVPSSKICLPLKHPFFPPLPFFPVNRSHYLFPEKSGRKGRQATCRATHLCSDIFITRDALTLHVFLLIGKAFSSFVPVRTFDGDNFADFRRWNSQKPDALLWWCSDSLKFQRTSTKGRERVGNKQLAIAILIRKRKVWRGMKKTFLWLNFESRKLSEMNLWRVENLRPEAMIRRRVEKWAVAKLMLCSWLEFSAEDPLQESHVDDLTKAALNSSSSSSLKQKSQFASNGSRKNNSKKDSIHRILTVCER